MNNILIEGVQHFLDSGLQFADIEAISDQNLGVSDNSPRTVAEVERLSVIQTQPFPGVGLY